MQRNEGESGGPLQTVYRKIIGLDWKHLPLNSKETAPLTQLPIYQVAGIISIPSRCGSGLPDVYTKVSAFIPWIESIVWPTSNSATVTK
ncbi:hypothetical protein ONE63_003370 [Megalurothrips usitatus]|uniref:Peptidase S1 domain-containing protein n=1 Tax=Megalurothrips usitatus TaxID=439358 RepID=A0AAV7XAT1_9NEOP|nr:hypothetical protein ONE63_003370 [Megalurothrips usitatus]